MAPHLYFHFPFCESRCSYCDFYAIGLARAPLERRDRLYSALARESERVAEGYTGHVNTIFLGGGTPSLVPLPWLERIFAPWRRRLAPDLEWTIECNPSSITRANLDAYRELGVNRISVGVQTLDDAKLRLLGRAHDSMKAREALQAVFDAGFSNVSADLMCGLPGQTVEELEQDIRELTGFPITHLSCYLLTLKQEHPLHGSLPDEDTQLAHLLSVSETLTQAGFLQYEISNFAKPGFEARHNLAYWTGAAYAGLGPSAHSFDPVARRRWRNVPSAEAYCARMETSQAPSDWEENLSPEESRMERVLLGLRLAKGLPLSEFAQNSAKIHALGTIGLIDASADRIRLTPRGFALSDQVIAALS